MAYIELDLQQRRAIKDTTDSVPCVVLTAEAAGRHIAAPSRGVLPQKKPGEGLKEPHLQADDSGYNNALGCIKIVVSRAGLCGVREFNGLRWRTGKTHPLI